MTEFLDVLWNFAVNVVLAYLLPTGILGSILKIQKRRRVYPRGPEGGRELVRDCNVGLVGINGLFLLWSSISFWPEVFSKGLLLRVATVAFFVYFYHDRPQSVIAVPDTIIASIVWIYESTDRVLQLLPSYAGLRRALIMKTSDELRLHSFSGEEIPRLVAEQMLLTQTHFTCKSCGLQKDTTHLGDVLLNGNGQKLYFCDETSCRLEARDLYAKRFTKWRTGTGGLP